MTDTIQARLDGDGLRREAIAILDFGSQFSRLIARRVREARVYCELLPATATLTEIEALGARGVILSGGPNSVYDQEAPAVDQAILESGLPILGVCYGMQLLAHQLGGRVEPHTGRREYGPAEITVRASARDALFAGVDTGPDARLAVWMSHGDSVGAAPPGFQVIAESSTGAIAAMADGRNRIGIQFHPEVRHTPQGGAMLENFLFRVCGCAPSWVPGAFIEEAVARV